MRSILPILFLVIVASSASCQRSDSSQPAPSAKLSPSVGQTDSPPAAVNSTPTQQGSPNQQTKPKIDACTLLTTQEIQAVQREVVKETKLSGTSQGGFAVSQCFYTLPTFTKSISLTVTQKGDGANARDPRSFWTETFHREGEKVRGGEREAERKREEEREKERKRERGERRGEEEEEESAPPLKVTGIGDEAYWMGSRVGGALYVLKGNNYVRISIGGVDDPQTRIKKSKDLLQKALRRL